MSLLPNITPLNSLKNSPSVGDKTGDFSAPCCCLLEGIKYLNNFAPRTIYNFRHQYFRHSRGVANFLQAIENMSQESQSTTSTSPKHQIAAELEEGLNSSNLELPVMPRVASKVFTLTNDPNAEVSDLSKLIHSDQSIASHVLRIANSAAYGGGDQIVSLQQAVARLGMNLLGEIAIAVSVQSDLFKAPGFEAQITQLLRHALASAAYGKEISRKRRRNVEGQFLCGLLHSVGKPIAVQLIAKLTKEKDLTLDKKSVAQLAGAFHRKIAAKVAVDWKLPEQLPVHHLLQAIRVRCDLPIAAARELGYQSRQFQSERTH